MTLMESQRHAEHSESQLQEEWTFSTMHLYIRLLACEYTGHNLCTISPPLMVFPLLLMSLALKSSAADGTENEFGAADGVDPLVRSVNISNVCQHRYPIMVHVPFPTDLHFRWNIRC